ncbi:MAG: hypothetical protein OQK19_00710 [Sedimenticola sp.]|jgi:hypothetical protein|uniref:Uncharacterized protein n=2 Tax=Sedimenticola TaxID=349742 RepID=A0A558CGM0_9GAMM|nr:hypothetical protein [Sedimenticola selenatireducens]MCW8847237.1 hypothetical protein [Sedimenticola sp.]TVT47908.1 MAG: hypothetical protein FHK82_17955 [Sedimenticola thiotaurini]MCW8882030.1 hypothetical protein [Sedimenticola sp.]MCW8946486.1 hypothetical protein [Sedimenticola sp.]MCW8949419.1 hypothetical protein [Sedimenticola sp.]
MNIAVLKTGLFPDAETVEAGIDHLLSSCNLYLYDATRDDLTDSDWDRVLDEILVAERLIVI